MSDLTDKQARLATLIKIRDSGISDIRDDAQRVAYRSMNELLQAIAVLEAEISTLAGSSSSRGPRYVYQSGKGL